MLNASNGSQIVQLAQQSLNFTLYDTRWVPSSARLCALGAFPKGTGCLQVLELQGTQLKVVSEAEKPSSFKCSTFGAAGPKTRHLGTGNYAGQVEVWDLERLDAATFTASSGSKGINGIDGCGGQAAGGGPPELATAGRDGAVRVWDVRQPDAPVAEFSAADHGADKAPECWAVAFGNSCTDEDRCLLAGYSDGQIRLYDLRTNTLRWQGRVPTGVCSVSFDRRDIAMNKFMASGMEGQHHVFEARTQHPSEGFARVSGKVARGATLWQCAPLPQNRDVWGTTSGGGSLHVFTYHYPDQRSVKDGQGTDRGVAGTIEELAEATLSAQPLTALSWSPDKAGLFCCAALDQCLRVGCVTKLQSV